jgi:F-type H+-transporting ATPase subunit b
VARERILADAQAAARLERQRAVEDITAAKNVALQEMTQKSVDLAVALAGRLVRRNLSGEDHAQLVREVLDQFPSKN